jgi:hypothetical protein
VRKRTPAAYAGIVPTTSSSVGDLSSYVTSNCDLSQCRNRAEDGRAYTLSVRPIIEVVWLLALDSHHAGILEAE